MCQCCVLCLVAQSCLTFRDPMNCSLPGFSVLGLLQARVLEWLAMPSSRGPSQPRDWSQVSRTGRWVLYQRNYQGSPSVPIFSSESDSHSVVSDSLWPHGLYSQSTEVSSLFLPQGIFPTKGPTRVSWIARGFFTNWALREARKYFKVIIKCLLFFYCAMFYTT